MPNRLQIHVLLDYVLAKTKFKNLNLEDPALGLNEEDEETIKNIFLGSHPLDVTTLHTTIK